MIELSKVNLYEKPKNYPVPPVDRFWRYVQKTETCWVWTGCHTKGGYGLIRYDGKPVRAHRLSWVHHNGAIPDGLFVLHRCDNPPCVNPAHLFLGTQLENAQDRTAKGRSLQLVCRRGHAMSPDNVYANRRGTRRRCRRCNLDYCAAKWAAAHGKNA